MPPCAPQHTLVGLFYDRVSISIEPDCQKSKSYKPKSLVFCEVTFFLAREDIFLLGKVVQDFSLQFDLSGGETSWLICVRRDRGRQSQKVGGHQKNMLT